MMIFIPQRPHRFSLNTAARAAVQKQAAVASKTDLTTSISHSVGRRH